MKPIIADEIEKYALGHSPEESELLLELARETYAKTSLPQMQVGRMAGAFLRLLVRLTQARRILEIGTFTGYSALVMAEGLPEDGRIITCDIDLETTAIARRFWARSPHGSKIELRLGRALETLKTLTGPFDMAFIDADKENYPAYWEAVLTLLRPGGLIVADNVLWSGRVLEPKEKSDHAISEFNRRVQNDAGVEAVMLTVRDGMTLAWKRP